MGGIVVLWVAVLNLIELGKGCHICRLKSIGKPETAPYRRDPSCQNKIADPNHTAEWDFEMVRKASKGSRNVPRVLGIPPLSRTLRVVFSLVSCSGFRFKPPQTSGITKSGEVVMTLHYLPCHNLICAQNKFPFPAFIPPCSNGIRGEHQGWVITASKVGQKRGILSRTKHHQFLYT